MRARMAVLQSSSTDTPLDAKLTALDDLEQLIESIDNANNLGPLGLWAPLLALLRHDDDDNDEQQQQHPDVRRMAAWCVGTAVQNNPVAQERALVGGAVPLLLRMLAAEPQRPEGERRKARYALSSLVRNFQPGLDAVVKAMGEEGKVDAGDMEAIDGLLDRLCR